MHIYFYNAFIRLYITGIRTAALWNKKASQWVSGRRSFPVCKVSGPCIWMHTASLGEFEQGRPVIESLREKYPGHRIVVTFFSPSGYEIRKNFQGADDIFYLPVDTKENADRFIDHIQPSLVIWIKYDFWYHYLMALRSRNIPVLLISSIFRSKQPFFKSYGKLWRQMLASFTHIFVQNESSLALIEPIVGEKVSINGDTRFDRVIDIAGQFQEIEMIQAFCGSSRVIVAGSTWEEDEAQLVHFVKANPNIKFIIAPHEITAVHLRDVKKKFMDAVFFSDLKSTDAPLPAQVLIIDNIGMLSRLYKYAHIAYIGGGFNSSGIHNVLEAAVYGVPVVFGPIYEKFAEARSLVELYGAFSFANAPELEKILQDLLGDAALLHKAGVVARNYVFGNGGATKRIVDHIAENRLLTN